MCVFACFKRKLSNLSLNNFWLRFSVQWMNPWKLLWNMSIHFLLLGSIGFLKSRQIAVSVEFSSAQAPFSTFRIRSSIKSSWLSVNINCHPQKKNIKEYQKRAQTPTLKKIWKVLSYSKRVEIAIPSWGVARHQNISKAPSRASSATFKTGSVSVTSSTAIPTFHPLAVKSFWSPLVIS